MGVGLGLRLWSRQTRRVIGKLARASTLTISAALACAAVDCAAQSNLSIDKAVWTEGVDRETRSAGAQLKLPVSPARKVFLWMQLRGTPTLLERLKNHPEGRTSIRHVWYRYDSDSLVEDASVSLDIGRKADLRKLEYQLDAEGAFTWRVWSTRDKLTIGNWRVDVVWEDGEPIACESSTGDEPCSYYLEVR